MYLNVNVPQSSDSSSVPRTPEILSLLSGAPLENPVNFSGLILNSGLSFREEDSNPSWASSDPSPDTPVGPSVDNTRTFLVKEGLKLTIQKKRQANGGHESLELQQEEVEEHIREELTPEDEERRRRRRERNKLAATKCRNRKKEKTGLLMKESDTLEVQNFNMKNEIQNLEKEKQRLSNVLAKHSHNCVKTGTAVKHFYLESYPPYFTPNPVNVPGGFTTSFPYPYGPNPGTTGSSTELYSYSFHERDSTGSLASANSFSSSSLTDYCDGSSLDSTLQSLKMTLHQM